MKKAVELYIIACLTTVSSGSFNGSRLTFPV